MMETLILSSLRAMFSWTVSTRSGVITIHFQVQFYSKLVIIKKNGREPLNNQNIINQATGKMNIYRALSTWKFTIYYLLRQKNMGNIND